jgi:hypothetical protein
MRDGYLQAAGSLELGPKLVETPLVTGHGGGAELGEGWRWCEL